MTPMIAPKRKSLPLRCHRCGKQHLQNWRWLELNTWTNVFHIPGTIATGDSQGLFAFGTSCARRELAPKGRLDDEK